MATYTNLQGETFDLPPMTLKLNAIQERVARAEAAEPRFAAMLEWCKAVLPSEEVAKTVGAKAVDKADLVKLQILYMKTKSLYDAEIRAATDDANADAMEQLARLSETMSGIARGIAAVDKRR